MVTPAALFGRPAEALADESKPLSFGIIRRSSAAIPVTGGTGRTSGVLKALAHDVAVPARGGTGSDDQPHRGKASARVAQGFRNPQPRTIDIWPTSDHRRNIPVTMP
jgi:hypothetical protein